MLLEMERRFGDIQLVVMPIYGLGHQLDWDAARVEKVQWLEDHVLAIPTTGDFVTLDRGF